MSGTPVEASAKDVSSRPQFGGRLLLNEDDVFKHNAWDNVVWGEQQEQDALAAVAKNSAVTISPEDIHKLELESAQNWDKFYDKHQNKFFKNRNWLFTEFPELAPHLSETFPVKINPADSESFLLHSTNNSNCSAKPVGSVDRKSEPSQTSHFEKDESSESSSNKLTTSLETDSNSAKLEQAPRCSQETVSQDDTCNDTNELDTLGSSITPFHGNDDIDQSILCKPPVVTTEVVAITTAASTTDHTEFPGAGASYRVLEVGCGVGNTIFPLLQTNNDPGLFVYGGDFSSTAIDIVRESQDYDTKRCNAFVLDVTSPEWTVPFPPNSLDVITCIYVMSAINPDKHSHVAQQVYRYLKPGGVVLFRDYGRYDLAQLRFKKGKCIADNYYVRGDGTKSYFFTQDEIREVFVEAGLQEKQNIVDRRLQVNRGKQITMYRVWIQGKYTKPHYS